MHVVSPMLYNVARFGIVTPCPMLVAIQLASSEAPDDDDTLIRICGKQSSQMNALTESA